MSINGNWLRVTPAELEHAKDDLDWAYACAREASDDADRTHSTGKAWHSLAYLLDRCGLGIPIVSGAEQFIDESVGEVENEHGYLAWEVDWGYGPPRYLTPEQVAVAAAELAAISGDDLIRGVDQAELVQAEIYPDVWDRPDELPWAAHHLPGVKQFFASAAKDGDAVICWLD
ncbi:hypothetical protein Cme02nite_00640 [Catellatospora methionotrophica]|uniref:DUF1877 family protein n=1 Tax=Catellatospora methionotrophica TaxID=121620 RepID=A0A8J3PC82_9ACTN|nr:DUF1877 family protein [Catellatospora methionotrophica]GIG11732.1 hypothetical protein Cme02nite_00640 [Catellatospora methionotrophica]